MDHSGHSLHQMDMDHGHMDHGSPMDQGHRCNMNMLFTWSTQDLCIIFRGWHVHNTFSLILSLLAIVALCAGYEAVREVSRRYEAAIKERLANIPTGAMPVGDGDDADESSSPLWVGNRRQSVEKQTDIIKAMLYAVQVFYSFFIMLLFMTYNGWVMIAVAVGAFIGHLVWGKTSGTKTVACH